MQAPATPSGDPRPRRSASHRGGQTLRASCALLALAAALALAAPAAAQAHHGEASSGIVILAEAADGRAFAGNLEHFTVVVHGDDAVPDFHQDMHVRVLFNGATWFETTPASGHDYDGVNSFDVVFPAEGVFRVEVLLDGDVAAHMEGPVDARPQGSLAAEVSVAGMEPFLAGREVTLHVDVEAPGASANHVDCWIEVWRGGRLLDRAKTHPHGTVHELDYAFVEGGQYVVRAIAASQPAGDGPTLLPGVDEVAVNVLPGPPANSPATPRMPPQELNAVAEAASDPPYRLVATFDPYTVITPDTLQHLAVLALDEATGATAPHVDFTLLHAGPAMRHLGSASMHEHDGVLELAALMSVPGQHQLTIDASSGNWSARLETAYTVAPLAAAAQPGPIAFTLEGAEGLRAGAAANLTIAAMDAAGMPWAHSELEVEAVPAAGGLPVLRAKLHTHDDGLFAFRLALPAEGGYVLRLSPSPLLSAPPAGYGGGDLAEGIGFNLQAGAGALPPAPGAQDGLTLGADARESPPAGIPLLALALAALAVAAARRS